MTERDVLPIEFLRHLEDLAKQAVKDGTLKRMPAGIDLSEEAAKKFGVPVGHYKRVGTMQWVRYYRGHLIDMLKLCGADRIYIGIKLTSIMQTSTGPVAMCEFGFFDKRTQKSMLGMSGMQLHKDTMAMIGLDAKCEVAHDATVCDLASPDAWRDLNPTKPEGPTDEKKEGQESSP